MPTNHVISIRDQHISVCDARVVAGSKDFDTFTIDADSEWDGLSVVVAFGSGDERVLVSYGGEPAEIPRQVISSPGWLEVSVVGYGAGGEVKATTVAARHAINVLPDGRVPDNPYPDSPDLLGQLVEAADKATDAAGEADKAAESASAAASAATSAADAAAKAADRADESAKGADEAAEDARNAAQAAGEKSLYAYADPDNDELIILEYPAFLESEDGGSVYLTLEGSDN